MYKKIFSIAIVLFAIISCTTKTLDPGVTKSAKVANEWWVNYYVDGVDQYKTVKLSTYNVAANNDSIWIDDLENFWQVKFRAKFNADNLTFSAANATNEYYESSVTVTEGKIMPKMAKSATGVVTDSIYFKIEYSDDPGTIYEVKGTGRTMWSPDDY
jgi:hypothetical protein